MRALAPTGPAATCSTSAAAPASTCPASRRRPRTVHRRRAAPRPRRARPRAVPAGSPNVTVLPGTAQARPAARRVGRRRARPVGLLLRAGLRARAGRARPRGAPRRHGVRDRQRRRRARRSARWFRRGYPSVDPVAVERFWAAHGWSAHAARHRLALRPPRRPRGRRAHRVRRRESPTRSWPSTRAPRSTTRSTCGGSGSSRQLTELRLEAAPQALSCSRTASVGGEQHARAPAIGRRARAGPRGRAPPRPRPPRAAGAPRSGPAGHDLGDLRVVEADHGDVAPRAQAALGEGVQHAHGQVSQAQTNAVAGASSSSTARGLARRSRRCPRPREARPVVGRPRACIALGPARAPVLADAGVLAPADPGDPGVALVEQVVGGQLGAGGAVDVDPGVRRRRGRPTAGRTPRTAPAGSVSQAACGLPR